MCNLTGGNTVTLDTSKPFLSRELLDQRREQRRFLASLPDWLLEEHGPVSLNSVPDLPPNAARLESSFRNYVDETRNAYSASLTKLASSRVSNEDLAAVEYLRSWERALFDLGIITTSNEFFASMFEYFKERMDGKANGTVDESVASSISEFLTEVIPALEMADALANDGYRDHRIARK